MQLAGPHDGRSCSVRAGQLGRLRSRRRGGELGCPVRDLSLSELLDPHPTSIPPALRVDRQRSRPRARKTSGRSIRRNEHRWSTVRHIGGQHRHLRSDPPPCRARRAALPSFGSLRAISREGVHLRRKRCLRPSRLDRPILRPEEPGGAKRHLALAASAAPRRVVCGICSRRKHHLSAGKPG